MKHFQISVQKELSLVKSPAATKSKIEFYEQEYGLSHDDLSEDEKKILSKISDLKEKKIKVVEFKWLFLLSPKNPNFNLQINQDLLCIFEEKIFQLIEHAVLLQLHSNTQLTGGMNCLI